MAHQLIQTPISPAYEPTQKKSSTFDRRIERRLTELLWTLGIPVHMKGYHYLRDVVEHTLESGGTIPSLSNDLYPIVAAAYQTTTACVERNIRSAIETAWRRGKLSAAPSLFGRNINPAYDKPTNAEMIALLCERIRIDIGM